MANSASNQEAAAGQAAPVGSPPIQWRSYGAPPLPARDSVARQESQAAAMPSIELPITPLPRWGLPNVQDALVLHEQGQFRLSSLLAEALSQDPRIAAALSTRVRAITALDLQWQPADDSPRARQIAARAEEEWPRWVTEQEAEQLHRWMLLLGCSLGQLVWDRDQEPWTPLFNSWHPSNLFWFWDWQRRFGRWQLITAQGVVEPAAGDGQWVFARTTEKRPWMQGLVRALATRFVARYECLDAWARLNEKYGLAFLINSVPMTADNAYVEALARQLENLGSEPVITLRQGDPSNRWEVKFEQIQPSAFQTFLEADKRWADDIAIALLGQNLTSDVQGGSRAAADVHNDVRREIVRADAQILSSVWRQQVLRPWAAVNFGSADLAPVLSYRVDPPEDLQAKTAAIAQLSSALSGFQQAGVLGDVDVPRLLERVGVPLSSHSAPAFDATDTAQLSLAVLPPRRKSRLADSF